MNNYCTNTEINSQVKLNWNDAWCCCQLLNTELVIDIVL